MIRLKIMSPDEGLIFDEDVKYVDVLSLDGHIGLQEKITPMVCKLKKGPCTITKKDGSKVVALILGALLYNDRELGIKIMANNVAWADQVDLQSTSKRIEELNALISRAKSNDRRVLEYKNELFKNQAIIEALKNFDTNATKR